jgi:hypothetical protein
MTNMKQKFLDAGLRLAVANLLRDFGCWLQAFAQAADLSL